MEIAKVQFLDKDGNVTAEFDRVVDIALRTREDIHDTIWDWENNLDNGADDAIVEKITDEVIEVLGNIGEYCDSDELWEVYRDVCRKLGV